MARGRQYPIELYAWSQGVALATSTNMARGGFAIEPLEDSFLRVCPVLPWVWSPQGYGAERPPQYSIKASIEQSA